MSRKSRLESAFTKNDKPEVVAENPSNPFTIQLPSENDWVEFTSPEYDKYAYQWEYVNDHYTGEILDDAKIGSYLFQRAQSESSTDYEERKRIASQPYHLSYLFDTLAGLSFTADRNVKITLQDDESDFGLGDPEVPGTPAFNILNNIDGSGTNFDPFWQGFLIDLLRYHVVYLVANGVIEETFVDKDGNANSKEISPPHLKKLAPTSVTNVFYEGTRLVGAVVKHETDGREAIFDKPEKRIRYTVYLLEGSETFEVRKDRAGTKTIVRLDELSVSYEYWDSQDKNHRILPIFPVRLNLPRYIAYQAARRINSVFNMESERDAAVRKGNLARLVIVGSEGFFNELISKVSKGFNALRGDPKHSQKHYYLEPPTAPAALAGEIIKDRISDFLFTTFREYSNAAKQKTATEVSQDRRAGLEALLVIVLSSLTEAQSNALLRLEQTYNPDKPDTWGVATVTRDPDFQYISTKEVVDKMTELFFPGKQIPIGNAGLTSVAKIVADYYGVDYDEDELEAGVEAQEAQNAQTETALSAFGL